MPDPLFVGLYREADKLRWPAPDEVRRRGHRAQVRRRVTIAAASVLVLLASGVLAGQALGGEASPPPAATDPPTVSPSPTPSAAPSPTPSSPATPSPSAPESADPPGTSPSGQSLAPAMLQEADLQAVDLPPGGWEPLRSGWNGDWSFAYSASAVCTKRPLLSVSQVDIREQVYREQRHTEGSLTVIQRVSRYGAGDAERYLDYVRAQVEACDPRRRAEGLRIHDEGFAGADSVFVIASHGPGFEGPHIFVRQGDLVTELWAKPGLDTEAIPLARLAADRLCHATAC